MDEKLLLSRQRLQTFLICRRRFELRYLRRLPWPAAPVDEEAAASLARGQQFHELVQRHFLGLPADPALIEDAALRRWQRLFQSSGPPLPPGQRLVETSLTAPVGGHLLTGRFDLVVIGENEDGRPFAHVFDWKTGAPPHEAALRRDWQTRLYLALLAEGGAALWAGGRPTRLAPEDVSLTYWFVQQPHAPLTIGYSAAAHENNWEEITAVVAEIEAALARGEWPLTDDTAHCRVCAYQAFCGRQAAGRAAVAPAPDEDAEPDEMDWLPEPERP